MREFLASLYALLLAMPVIVANHRTAFAKQVHALEGAKIAHMASGYDAEMGLFADIGHTPNDSFVGGDQLYRTIRCQEEVERRVACGNFDKWT